VLLRRKLIIKNYNKSLVLNINHCSIDQLFILKNVSKTHSETKLYISQKLRIFLKGTG